MRLAEESDDFVAFLPKSDFASDRNHLACTIGARYDRELKWKWVVALDC